MGKASRSVRWRTPWNFETNPLEIARATLGQADIQADVLGLGLLAAEYGCMIHPCKGCASTDSWRRNRVCPSAVKAGSSCPATVRQRIDAPETTG